MTDSPLRRRPRAQRTLALLERDRDAAGALRGALATLGNAEAVPVRAPGPALPTWGRLAGAIDPGRAARRLEDVPASPDGE